MPPSPMQIVGVCGGMALAFWLLSAGAPASRAQTPPSADALRQAVRDVDREQVAAEALRAADRYMETWNTRDPIAWAASLHFPHVRPGAGPFRLTRTPEEYARGVNFERTLASGWHRSQWDSYDVFQAGAAKAHVAGHYSRYNLAGERIRTTYITYIVTKQGERWGIQARFAAGSADLPDDRRAASDAAAVRAVETYFDALDDATDVEGLAATLNYPHVRVADGSVELWETAEAYAAGSQAGRLRTWAGTRLDWAEPVQVGAGGVNVAVRYSRLNPRGETLSSYEAVYLVTTRDGRTAIQARSSFAP